MSGSLYKRRGFTLIEMLVVISIISLLASIVLASLNSARAKARDARRISALQEFRNGLELFYDKYGKYPCADVRHTFGNIVYGIDASGDGQFLSGNPLPMPGSTVRDNGCPDDDSGAAESGGDPKTGLQQENLLPIYLTSGSPGGINDPLFSNPVYFYVYFVPRNRQSYILTAALETKPDLMANDGGKCPERYEIGSGLSSGRFYQFDDSVSGYSGTLDDYDYPYNPGLSSSGCWEKYGICSVPPSALGKGC